MKIRKLTKGVIALSILSMLVSGVLVASASSDETSTTGIASTAIKNHGRGFNGVKPENMTAEQKAAMEAKKTEGDVKMNAIKVALTAGDYNAWVTAEKALNANSPILSKISADNFDKYVEANNLRIKAETIMKELGVGGPGMGNGSGLGMDHGRGGFGQKMGTGFGNSDGESQK
ncbi:MAG: hypothetical protein WC458_00400 [Patescibacteria group bacterium]